MREDKDSLIRVTEDADGLGQVIIHLEGGGETGVEGLPFVIGVFVLRLSELGEVVGEGT